MVYRVLIGAIPLLIAALFFTGAMPLSTVVGSGGVHRPAEEAQAREAASTRSPAPPEKVTNAKEASELFRSVDASLDEEIKRRAPEEKRSKERVRREQLRQKGQSDWAPQGGGWGN